MRTRIRDQWPTLLVAALAGTFGVMLLHVTGLLSAAIAADVRWRGPSQPGRERSPL